MSHGVVVLISGSGTNLQAVIDAIHQGRLPATIRLVVSNRDDAGGLARARAADIPCRVVPHQAFPDRASFESALIEVIRPHAPDTLVLAGFMRILSPLLVRTFADRLLNIHPSLLPKYRGLHTHRRALEAADTEHGCSIHFVTDELDGGPLVAQARVPVLENDTEESLSKRVLQREHQLLPEVLRWRAERRLVLTSNGVMMDNVALPSGGIVFDYEDSIHY